MVLATLLALYTLTEHCRAESTAACRKELPGFSRGLGHL
jgi:hypothetical protein